MPLWAFEISFYVATPNHGTSGDFQLQDTGQIWRDVSHCLFIIELTLIGKGPKVRHIHDAYLEAG